MTTLIYRSGVIAMDSRVTEDGLMCGKVVKGRQTKNYLLAGCGDMEEVQAFLDWAEAGFKEADKVKYGLASREVEVSGIAVDREHRVLIFESRLYPYPMEAPYYVFGSGGQVALGALAMGASAYKAVKIASQFDTATGGDIKLLSFRRRKAKPNATTNNK